jgi:extracellular elastinolytic metalloproteinase
LLRFSPALRRLLLPATVVAGLALVSTSAGAPGERDRSAEPRSERAKAFFDVRARAAAAPARTNAAQSSLRRSLGVQGVVDVDPLTGTPRVVAKLDGFLTEPSSRDAKDIALDYVRAHPDVFKLDEDDLAGLVLKKDYTDVNGVRHLVWAQTAGGIPAFDNDLRANLTSDGRLINVLGSPLPDLEVPATDPALGATDALGSALENVGRAARNPRVTARGTGAQQATRFAGGDRANLVLLNTGNGVELAWHVTATADGDEVYNSLVDASSGEVLRRTNQVKDVGGGEVWDYYPGASVGGTPTFRDFETPGWLLPGATRLDGPNAHVFSDWDDDDKVDLSGTFGSEETNPSSIHSFTVFENPPYQGYCEPTHDSVCSWDSFDNGRFPGPVGWNANRRQNAVQVFYFVNNFHDYLRNDPSIGFGATSTEGFEGTDEVLAHASDGANIGGGILGPNMPDDFHVNNANMFTPPNGQAPTMQMYLFTSFDVFSDDPTADANGGDDASVVYHEYTHGLSNRLITYSNGWGALDAHQSGSMGEGWSDWYAMDYLVEEGFAPDTPASDVILGAYLGNGNSIFRSKALDCPVAPDPCDGYTYGDLGTISGSGPEVHDDGEIWGQTLWDLREHADVGVAAARALVTEGMRLSPPNPSFLDMRNAILLADSAMGGADRAHIWELFRARGMGYFAATRDANDTRPIESFEPLPVPGETGTLKGVVRDPDAGNTPVAGARVWIPGNSDGLQAVTGSNGAYLIADVPAGTYPLIRVSRSRYDAQEAHDVIITNGAETTRNFSIRRDWSARTAGARITSFTPPDYAEFGCGPAGAIDQSGNTGWASDTPPPSRQITVKLPSFVDVKAFAVDPGATCGDPENAALGRFRLFISKNGSTFTQVADRTFSAMHNHTLNLVNVPDKNGIRYVRLVMLSSQGHPFFMDMSELSVYGKLRPACLGLAATRIGTEGRNTIRGSRGADIIVASGGNDRILGRGGKDVVCGGPGNDTIVGGSGVDRIDAGSGNDKVNTRDGLRERTIRGGSGSDRLRKDRRDRATGFERRY